MPSWTLELAGRASEIYRNWSDRFPYFTEGDSPSWREPANPPVQLGQRGLLAGEALFGVFASFLRVSQNQGRDVG